MVIMHHFRDLEVASVRASAAQSVCFLCLLVLTWNSYVDGRGLGKGAGVRGENVGQCVRYGVGAEADPYHAPESVIRRFVEKGFLCRMDGASQNPVTFE